jgi:vancomycin resistance protein YoaR
MTSVTTTSQTHQDGSSLHNPWLIRLPILFVSGGLLLLLILMVFVGLFQLRFQSRILPGVSAYGIRLADMTPEQARDALEAAFNYDESTVFTFRDGDAFWQLTAGELGVSFDAEATVAEAFAAGHSGNMVVDVIDQALVWLNGYSVAPTVRYDQNVAVQNLMAIANEINRQPRDASLTIDGTNVTATPAETGRMVDILATLNRLTDTIAQLGTGTEVALVIDETPPRVVDSEGAAAKARAALSSPVTLVAQDDDGTALGPWTASVDQIAHILSLRLVDNGQGEYVYDVSLDMNVFSGFLEVLSPGLLRLPQNARFSFDEANGTLQVLQPGVAGRALNVAETLARMEAAVFQSGNRTAMMAFDYSEPAYHDNIAAADLGITELVSEATTYYSGSTQPRRDNIAQAASRFNGIIIGPGEEFSFNEWVGDISPEAGFVAGKIIAGGRTIDGVGGGVCQVSTTAFQAAFYAGFPVLERYAHGYDVGYYRAGEGLGMDAAIYTPDLDFRFLNDTPYHLLIETSVFPGNDALQFRFYSTNPGRRVVKEGPVITNVQAPAATQYEVNPEFQPGQSLQVDWAAEGKDVSVTRIVLDDAGNELRRDQFVSHYQPWGAIIQVAPGGAPGN